MKFWKLFSLLILVSSSVFAAPKELDKVVVVVNDGVILQSEVDTSLKMLKASATHQGDKLPNHKILQDQVIEKLIMDKLQQQEAIRIGVKIDDERLNEAIKHIAKERKVSVAQLTKSLRKSGLSYSEYREQIRKEVAASEARNALVRRRINILPTEVEHLAEALAQHKNATVQYKIEHIQLNYSDDVDKSDIEKQANELVTKLKAGANFNTMAYAYSKGPKALQGGDWHWMRKEEMPTIFADQIHMQNKGAIIGPFRSGIGFHILKIADIKGLKSIAVTEVNARHILIKPTVILSDAGAKKELNEFIQRIKSGEATFGELAHQYSQDPGSAAQNGELGYQTPDLYVPEFKEKVETLPVGKISKPFKTVHGWHIVEVLDRRKVDHTGAAMKNKAYRILFSRKFNEESETWLQELRAGAFVEKLNAEEQGTQDND